MSNTDEFMVWSNKSDSHFSQRNYHLYNYNLRNSHSIVCIIHILVALSWPLIWYIREILWSLMCSVFNVWYCYNMPRLNCRILYNLFCNFFFVVVQKWIHTLTDKLIAEINYCSALCLLLTNVVIFRWWGNVDTMKIKFCTSVILCSPRVKLKIL